MSFQKNIKNKIIAFRRSGEAYDYSSFKNFLYDNQEKISELNTRWLVSICDTIVDGELITGDNPAEASRAMLITTFINTIKLCATDQLLYNQEFSERNLKEVRTKKPAPELWDGVVIFRPDHNIGDMTWNLFKRIKLCLKSSPLLANIFKVVVKRVEEGNNPLSDLNKYHTQVFKTA